MQPRTPQFTSVVLRPLGDRTLFSTHEEARGLWLRLATIRGLAEIVLVPDSAVLVFAGAAPELGPILSATTRWLNHQRGDGGALWRPRRRPTRLPARERRGFARHMFMRPVVAGLVDCPLSWPWSSYRDRTGMTLEPVLPPVPDPRGLHARLTLDATDWQPLPAAPWRRVSTECVLASLSALLRRPRHSIMATGVGRRQAASACAEFCGLSRRQLAYRLGVSRYVAQRLEPLEPDVGGLIMSVLGDPRFGSVEGAVLRAPSAHDPAGWTPSRQDASVSRRPPAGPW